MAKEKVRRGTSITGWWAMFPMTPEEPKRFPDRDGAVAYWPAKFTHFKVIMRVTYNPMTNNWKHTEPERFESPNQEAV